VIKVRALVLEPIDPGSILNGEFLEGHDFTSPTWTRMQKSQDLHLKSPGIPEISQIINPKP
jgi:plasmid maintenance system antidote protein VapI